MASDSSDHESSISEITWRTSLKALIFARLGIDSLFSRKTQSATISYDFTTIVTKPAKLSDRFKFLNVLL